MNTIKPPYQNLLLLLASILSFTLLFRAAIEFFHPKEGWLIVLLYKLGFEIGALKIISGAICLPVYDWLTGLWPHWPIFTAILAMLGIAFAHYKTEHIEHNE